MPEALLTLREAAELLKRIGAEKGKTIRSLERAVQEKRLDAERVDWGKKQRVYLTRSALERWLGQPVPQ